MKIDRKAGLHMDFKSHIPKTHPQLLRKLFLIAVGLCTALPILFTNPLTTHADGYLSDSELAAIVAQYNGTSSSTHGGNSAITNGVSYTRTGYLCYLLTKDGSPTGDPAYAFSSPSFNGIAGSKWVCTSRRGHSVSSWTGPAPWGVTPWENGGAPSNEPKIREWMLQPIDGAPQAYAFVKDIWGEAAAKNFSADEYILVIETIMNFQYSISNGSSNSDIVYVSRSSIEHDASQKAITITKDITDENVRKQILNSIVEQIITELQKYPNIKIVNNTSAGGDGGSRTFTSDPLIGTVPNLIQYKGQSTVFNSYTNKVAPHAEKIKVSEAGFTAYTGSGSNQLSDSEVQSYGVAMLIIHCKNDAIHTYSTS